MSKERELIKDMKILIECTSMGGLQRNADVLIGRAIELLAQPEQDNPQYLLDQVARLTAENAMLKEKWLAPRRKPLSEEEIGAHTPFYYYDTEQKAFTHGVRFAEVMHSIGGGE